MKTKLSLPIWTTKNLFSRCLMILYDGLREEIEESVNILIARGWIPYDVLTKALVGGMTIVGADFRDGILFVPEVLSGCKRDERRHGDPQAAAGGNRRTRVWARW